MVKKIAGSIALTFACFLVMIGGCALDSEKLTLPSVLILAGVAVGFIGYKLLMLKENN